MLEEELLPNVSNKTGRNSYILNYSIMETESDEEVAYPILESAKGAYPSITSCSYDRGYWSKENLCLVDKLGV